MRNAVLFIVTLVLTLVLVAASAFTWANGNDSLSLALFLTVVPMWWVMGKIAERLEGLMAAPLAIINALTAVIDRGDARAEGEKGWEAVRRPLRFVERNLAAPFEGTRWESELEVFPPANYYYDATIGLVVSEFEVDRWVQGFGGSDLS